MNDKAHRDAALPRPLVCAIEAATSGWREFEVACDLCAEDSRNACSDDNAPQGRLERAIARALLDVWRHGQGSAEAVGSAYALVAVRRRSCISK
jgi:hypothetical protein